MNMNEVRTYLLASLAGIFFTLLAFPVYAENDECYNGDCEQEESESAVTSTSGADASADATAEADADAKVYSEIDVDVRDSGNSKIRGSANNEVDIEFDVEGAKALVKESGNSESSSSVEGVEATGGKAIQGQRQSGTNEQGQETDVIVEVEINNPADDVVGAAKEIRKGMERSSPGAPRPAAATSLKCGDTGGFTLQTGVAGGGTSAPTFPCEVQRTIETVGMLGTGKFDRFFIRPLLYTRLGFKGLWSLLPVVGN